MMKLGSANTKAPSAWQLVEIDVDEQAPKFTYRLNHKKLRQVRAAAGHTSGAAAAENHRRAGRLSTPAVVQT